MSSERIPAGIYHGCRGVAGSEQYASKNGTDQIAVDVFMPDFGRALTTFMYFTEAAAPYSIERLRALGWTGNDLANLEGIDTQDVDVSVKYEVYDGKERMKVDIMTGGGRVKLDNPMDEKSKRAFAARMKSFVATAGTPKPPAVSNGRPPAARRPAQPPVESEVQNDDIPF